MQDIVNGGAALDSLMQNRFPVKLSYKLSRILVDVQRELKHFSDLRTKLIKQLGKEVSADQWQVTDENIAIFNAEFQELMELPVKIWGDKFKVEELGEISITPADLFAIRWLFESEAEETPIAVLSAEAAA